MPNRSLRCYAVGRKWRTNLEHPQTSDLEYCAEKSARKHRSLSVPSSIQVVKTVMEVAECNLCVTIVPFVDILYEGNEFTWNTKVTPVIHTSFPTLPWKYLTETTAVASIPFRMCPSHQSSKSSLQLATPCSNVPIPSSLKSQLRLTTPFPIVPIPLNLKVTDATG